MFGDSKEVSVTRSGRVEGEWQEPSQGRRPGPGHGGRDFIPSEVPSQRQVSEQRGDMLFIDLKKDCHV